MVVAYLFYAYGNGIVMVWLWYDYGVVLLGMIWLRYGYGTAMFMACVTVASISPNRKIQWFILRL